MNPQTSSPILSDFLFPALVAVLAAYFSYKATYIHSRKSKNAETLEQTITLIDNLILQFNKLLSVFDTLNSDIGSLSYFSLVNISKGQKINNILNGYTWNTYLISESQLRIQVLEAVDGVTTLINEINGLENYPLSEQDKAENLRNELNREFRNFRLGLLSQDVILSKKLKPEYAQKHIKGNSGDKKLKSIKVIVDEFVGELGKINGNITEMSKGNEKRRLLLSTRIVDQKTKISSLIIELNSFKEDL